MFARIRSDQEARTVKLSIGTPPGPHARELAIRAEELGYDGIWLFDSAAIYEDVWAHLALIADATERIGLGTAVLVPNLRHVMTTASAIATIDRLAPGRLSCAIGTGYTARLILGKPALSWQVTRSYVEQLRGLLRGDAVTIDGERCQMIHRPELATARPIEVPILLSAFGPKGLAITREIADGWMGMSPPPERFARAIQMVNGTVLAPGESAGARRVVDAVGPWQVGLYHFLWENHRDQLPNVPGGAAWLARIRSERPDEAEQHLAVHYSHCTHLSDADRIGLAAFGEQIPWNGWVGTAKDLLARAEQSAAGGATEILYTPAGDDLIGEAERFYGALESVQR
jgi:5,10-methylenetetrahydromethanopterin reductase